CPRGAGSRQAPGRRCHAERTPSLVSFLLKTRGPVMQRLSSATATLGVDRKEGKGRATGSVRTPAPPERAASPRKLTTPAAGVGQPRQINWLPRNRRGRRSEPGSDACPA